MHKLSCLLGTLALASVAAAQSQTVPAIFANTEWSASGNIWRAGINRVQCVYDSSNWSIQQPIQINSLEWRLVGAGVTNIVTYPSVNIYLQNSATDYLTPDLTFSRRTSRSRTTARSRSRPPRTTADRSPHRPSVERRRTATS